MEGRGSAPSHVTPVIPGQPTPPDAPCNLLQIAGVCVTVAAVTVYTLLRWRHSRRRVPSGVLTASMSGSGGGSDNQL